MFHKTRVLDLTQFGIVSKFYEKVAAKSVKLEHIAAIQMYWTKTPLPLFIFIILKVFFNGATFYVIK